MQYLIHTRAHSIEQQSFCESLFHTIAVIHSAAMKMHACNTIQQLRQPLCILRATALHKISGALMTVVHPNRCVQKTRKCKKKELPAANIGGRAWVFHPISFLSNR